MLLQSRVYAIGSDNNVGFKAVSVCEMQPRGGGGLDNSDATMAEPNCFGRKGCRESIQQISPMHAVQAIPAGRVGRDNRTNHGPVSPVVPGAVTDFRADCGQGFA